MRFSRSRHAFAGARQGAGAAAIAPPRQQRSTRGHRLTSIHLRPASIKHRWRGRKARGAPLAIRIFEMMTKFEAFVGGPPASLPGLRPFAPGISFVDQAGAAW